VHIKVFASIFEGNNQTPDHLFRSATLYPAELRVHNLVLFFCSFALSNKIILLDRAISFLKPMLTSQRCSI